MFHEPVSNYAVSYDYWTVMDLVALPTFYVCCQAYLVSCQTLYVSCPIYYVGFFPSW
jgi:hypothetical protein